MLKGGTFFCWQYIFFIVPLIGEIFRLIVMKKKHEYFTYIVCSPNNAMIYVGVTNSIFRRTKEYKDGLIVGFAQKYQCRKLVWYEENQYIRNAIAREKKNDLVEENNSDWKDLAKDWCLE